MSSQQKEVVRIQLVSKQVELRLMITLGSLNEASLHIMHLIVMSKRVQQHQITTNQLDDWSKWTERENVGVDEVVVSRTLGQIQIEVVERFLVPLQLLQANKLDKQTVLMFTIDLESVVEIVESLIKVTNVNEHFAAALQCWHRLPIDLQSSIE